MTFDGVGWLQPKKNLILFNVDARMEVVAQSSEPWAHIQKRPTTNSS